jgi:histidinol-phosphate aminotransferase
MIYFDRRAWLRSFTLAVGGLGASRLVGAKPSPAPAGGGSADHLVRLSLNENPYGPAPGVRSALQREFPNLCRYTVRAEYDVLLDLIAAREGVSKDHIILGEILAPLGTYLSLQGGPGGEFIHSDPGYMALIDSAVAVGGRAVAVPLDSQLQVDLPAMTAKLNQRTRAVFLVNPNNPTGIVSDSKQLRDFARETSRQALVIVDEVYLEFAGDFSQRTLVDLVRADENVIVFRTFDKAFGLGGLALGYGLLPIPIAKALSAQGFTEPLLFNRLAVAAATASLRDAEYLTHMARQVAEEREKWFQLFREVKARYTPSAGNFVFFETGLPHAEFAAAMLERGVEIGRVSQPYDRWARISIGLPEENTVARTAVRQLLHTAPV